MTKFNPVASWSNVPGNSGCVVEVVEGAPTLVRKRALAPEYFHRLFRQLAKQKSYLPPIMGVVVPQVIASDDMSFVMQRLMMLDAIEFLERSTPSVIQSRFQIIIALLQWEFSSSTVTPVSGAIFREKLASIQKNVPHDVWQQYYRKYANEFEHALPQEICLPLGICHGDLTFSNMMFSLNDNAVGLIDFLDSFLDSPLIDIAKLRQDTRFHWTSFRYLQAHDHAKIHIIDGWINSILFNAFEQHINSLEFWLIETINYLRIAPYVHQENEHRYLSQILDRIIFSQEKPHAYYSSRRRTI